MEKNTVEKQGKCARKALDGEESDTIKTPHDLGYKEIVKGIQLILEEARKGVRHWRCGGIRGRNRKSEGKKKASIPKTGQKWSKSDPIREAFQLKNTGDGSIREGGGGKHIKVIICKEKGG